MRNFGSRLLVGTALALSALAVSACGDTSNDVRSVAADSADSPNATTDATDATDVIGAATDDAFVDPQGTYTITIDPAWSETSGSFVKEVESWTVAAPANGFVSNVNVLTQAAPNTDLAAYMELSVKSMGTFELIESTTVTGTNGNSLGLLEYKGVVFGSPGDPPLHFLAAIDVLDGQAIIATLTTVEADFDALSSEVEPFLLSLQAT